MPTLNAIVKINHPALVGAGFSEGEKVVITPILAEKDMALVMKKVKTGAVHPNGMPETRIEIDVLQPKGSYLGARITNSIGITITDMGLYNLIGNYKLSEVFNKQ